ncbi:MAG: NTP transferase domain-containing protein [Firmicutes bacterium]|nr:NTP transferase domain-containing protein [Bacillota bacterium]
MRAILPLAGIGSRLRPHTHTLPKSLVPVAGKPILGHILDRLIPVGVSEVVLIVGQMGDMIVDYVSENYNFVVRVVNQEERRGLGHAVYLSREHVDPAEPVLIVLGDTIVEADLAAVVRSPHSVLGVREVDNPQSFGVVSLEGDRIADLVEKPANPPSNLAVVGVYYIKNTALLLNCLEYIIDQGITLKGEFQLTDALRRMIKLGEPMGVFPVESWFDCGNPESLLATNRYLLDRDGAVSAPLQNTVVIPPVHIARTARVANSVVGPYVSVADHAVVENCLIRDSILNEGAVVRDITLDGSLIGHNAVVTGRYTKLNIGDSSEIISGS